MSLSGKKKIDQLYSSYKFFNFNSRILALVMHALVLKLKNLQKVELISLISERFFT